MASLKNSVVAGFARLTSAINAVDVKTGSSVVAAGTKTLGYTNGKLTSVNGPGAATKSLTYAGNVLASVASINGDLTVTKNLSYTSGSLTSVETVVT